MRLIGKIDLQRCCEARVQRTLCKLWVLNQQMEQGEIIFVTRAECDVLSELGDGRCVARCIRCPDNRVLITGGYGRPDSPSRGAWIVR